MEKQKIEMNLQLFGGRGASGESLSSGSGKNINILNTEDVWSYRHNRDNEPFVDEINKGVGRIATDFPGVMDNVNTVDAAELGGKDREGTLGFYGDGQLALNQNYTDPDKMNNVYDKAVRDGYHPSRGGLSGTQAVALHEMGHALTDYYGKKMGTGDLDASAKVIVNNAYKESNGKGGTKAWAGKISGYAKDNFAECVAEAVCDWYCNGKKSSSVSQAIMTELKRAR